MKPFHLELLRAVHALQPHAEGFLILDHVKAARYGPPGGFWWEMRGPGLVAMYLELDTLENMGYVTHHYGPPVAVRGGRGKCYWELTEDGRRVLVEARERPRVTVGRPAWGIG